MFQELKFEKNDRIKRYETFDKFYACKMEEDRSVNDHVLRMSGYANRPAKLGIILPPEAIIDRVLQSLPPSYKIFVINYNMQGMNKSIAEMFAMLKVAESEIQKEHQVLMVNKTTSFKKNGKGKKGNFKKSGKAVSPPVKKTKAQPSQKPSAIIARGLVTGSGTTPSIWSTRRWPTPNKVYIIYMLLMCTSSALVVLPGYLIPIQLLTFITQSRNYGIDEGWRRMK